MDNSIVSRVTEFVKRNELLCKNNHVIVGVSGGADSICLLHILCSIKDEFNLKLTAIHINHMLRGEEALRDERYVVKFCECLGIDVIVERINVSKIAKDNKISEEEAGRMARYDTFHKHKKRLGANKIAVAHNKNDNAETVIMNVIRGCGINGLKGIDYCREDIIRPLIILKREEIESYCRLNNLEYMTDSTNTKPIYTRNKVRLKLIKIIDDILDVDIVSRIDKLSYLAREDNDFIASIAKKAFGRCVVRKDEDLVLLSVKELEREHKSIQRRIVLEAILGIKKNLKMIEYKHVESVLDLIDSRTGTNICLPKGLRVSKSYDVLKFYLKGNNKKDLDIFSVDLSKCESKLVGDNFIIETKVFDCDGGIKEEENNKYIVFLDYEKLGFEIEVRRRRDGDIFKPLNSNGTKKLKKYFIDKKIDRLERDSYYLLAKGKEIIWIVGDKVSDNYKVTKNTRKIVRVMFVSMI